MGRHEPIAVRETTAAAMLDMKPCEFRRLVDGGGYLQLAKLLEDSLATHPRDQITKEKT